MWRLIPWSCVFGLTWWDVNVISLLCITAIGVLMLYSGPDDAPLAAGPGPL